MSSPTLHRLLLLLLMFCIDTGAQTMDDCLTCHGDPDLVAERNGREISLFIDQGQYSGAIHGGFGCIDCHADLIGTEFPHTENLEQVDCASCHDDVAQTYFESVHGKLAAGDHPGPAAGCADCHGSHYIISPQTADSLAAAVKCGQCHQAIETQYDESLHGLAARRGERLAPNCWDCHGSHDIADAQSPDSRVTKFNIPFMCGKCHKEGTAVTRTYDIPQDSILYHYSFSIHGEGLFKKGLIVSAVCSDCHTAHHVLPHTDPRSSIFRDNVANTCRQCHSLIEEVHQKVIEGELWEKQPNKIPVCVDCHSPHKIRRVFYEQGISNQECLKCHANKDLTMTRNGITISLYIDTLETMQSVHRGTACAQCHTGANPEHARPCATISSKVDCAVCHADVVDTYNQSTHGVLAERGDANAPACVDCHGKHDMLRHDNTISPTFPTRVPDLCAKCHRAGSEVALRVAAEVNQQNIIKNYSMSIHGKGLLESGLVVTAMCTDCHTAHGELPASDPRSSVNRNNIARTCARCHNGIYEQFTQSIHFPDVAKTDKPLPVCDECHSSHTIVRTDLPAFKFEIINTCGRCHQDVTESYFETFHGKVSKLGFTAAAKCNDCHGSHLILPTWNPKSTLSRDNIVQTCGQCHEGSHRRFAGYLTHATHHDRDKYPILFYTFWFMTILLTGTFVVFGTHTLLWLPRSLIAARKRKKTEAPPTGKEFVRFKPLHRRLHILVIISFLGLAITGMTLKFSYLSWAQWLSGVLGGFESAGYIHRVCACITFFYFARHIVDLCKSKRTQQKTWRQFLFNRQSMLPNYQDLKDLIATLKWFIGLGERPAYGRWTYWEKFDYFAVFWGVAIIGTTGLILWFPETFTYILPGWFINVATIIHSDEALLAVGFIFTVHFFNTHFRPDKFPMDAVIFTGRVPLDEFKEDRPREYEELVNTGELEKHLADPLPDYVVKGLKIFGAVALAIGLCLILLIIWAEVFGYK